MIKFKMLANATLTAVSQWIGTILHTERLPVRSLVRAHALVADQVPGWGV